MKKILTSVVFFAAGLFAVNAQQLTKGDSFEYPVTTNFTFASNDGIMKKYTVTGENLIENPSFDNNATGWTGGDGKALGGYKIENSGGVDGGAYIIPGNGGKGGNASIGTAWPIETGKTYVFSYFVRQMNSDEAVAKEGYIVTSETNTPQGEETKTIMYAHEDANKAWTQNLVVTTAEYNYLQFCARWLGSSKGFDSFILAELTEEPNTTELAAWIEETEGYIDYFSEAEEEDKAIISGVLEEAKGTFDNENATATELNNMVKKLKNALLDFRVTNANEDELVDVTERYVTNPYFDNGLAGWTRTNDNVDKGSNIRFFEYFGENSRVLEIQNQPSKETHVSQTVYNLPLGYYRFTVQCVMNHTVDKAADPEAKSGAAIYCNGFELDMVTSETTTNGANKDNSHPETFTIEGVVSGDSMVVGFVGYPGTNFTYVAIDNVKLEYAGFEASIFIESLSNDVLNWISDNSDNLLPGIAYNLEEEAYAASDVIGEDEAIMNAAYIHLDSVFTAAKQSVKLVEQLNEDYVEFANFVEETHYKGYEEAMAFIDELATFLEMEDENAGYAELDAMIAKLEQAIYDYRMGQDASKDVPADYTFLIPNANFEEKGNWVWTIDAEGKDGWVGNCRPAMEAGESRQGVNLWGNKIISIDLHQELTGLPNGLYGISAELITQNENTADGYGDCTTDQHLYVTGINTAVSENLSAPAGWDAYEWRTLKTGYVVVIDGTLTIGAATNTGGETREGWFQATNFKLQYYGEASNEDLQVAYEATLAEAQALIPTLLKGDAAVLQTKIDAAIALSATNYGEAAALLVDPITVAKTAALTYNTYKTGAYQTAVGNIEGFGIADAQDVLGAAIAFADAITNADTTTTAALAAITEKLNAYNDYATYLDEVGYMLTDRSYATSNVDDVKATIAAQKADLTAAFQNKANVEDLKAKLQEVVSYMEKSAYLHAKAGDDVTGLIVNPTFDANATGWLVNKGTGNTETNASQHWSADAANRYMDSYNGTKKALNFHGSQVLTDIPNGTYTVKVATRADSIGAYIFALGEAITDTLVNDSTVMKQVVASTNTKWQEIEFHADSLGGIWQAEQDKWESQSNDYNETLHNANSGKGFGWTWATIDDIVVTNHEMVIGVTTDSLLTGKVFEGKWFSVDDWTLTLKAVGDNSNWTIESGIDNVAAVATKTVYYAIDGRQIALPGKGVNIVKTVYSDGRIEVKKVFVK